MSKGTKVFLFFTLLALSLLILILINWPSPKLKLIACDVGQGDAILVVHGKNQILIDGGPNSKVMDCLSRYIPFWDRSIDMVIVTHPQKDHFGGLIDVVERYNVKYFATSGLDAEGIEWETLEGLVGNSNTDTIELQSTRNINIGEINLDVIWPTSNFISSNKISVKDSNVLGVYDSDENPNNFSVVIHMRYGEFDALLTGDIEPEITDDMILAGEVSDIEYLKVPHHGSKNGLTRDLLEKSNPEIAVISSGKNPWGHPHKEILEMLRTKGLEVYRTDTSGHVILSTDGSSYSINTSR